MGTATNRTERTKVADFPAHARGCTYIYLLEGGGGAGAGGGGVVDPRAFESA
jgi:hypothetical protein